MTFPTDLVSTSAALSTTPSRKTKVATLSAPLGELDPDEIVVAVASLTGVPRQGRIGVGWSRAAVLTRRSSTPTLTISALDGAIDRLEACSGPGSEARRAEIIDALDADLTP